MSSPVHIDGISLDNLPEDRLREELRSRGQADSGSKTDLISRLEQVIYAQQGHLEGKSDGLPGGLTTVPPAKLFVGQLPLELTNDQLRQTFLPYGEIQETVILQDRMTNRSKGCGFVVFKQKSASDAAIAALDGKMVFPGSLKAIQVRYAHTDASQKAQVPMGPAEVKLYVGMLARETTEEDLRAMFEPYGDVKEVYLLRDKMSGQSKGSGFVKFSTRDEAVRAIKALNDIVRDKSAPGMLQVRFAETMAEKEMKKGAMFGRGMGNFGMNPAYGSAMGGPMGGYGMNMGYGAQMGMGMGAPPAMPMGPAGYGPMASMRMPAPVANQAKGPPGCNLFVHGIPDAFSDADLGQLFSNFGLVISAKVFVDKMTNMPKGYGFVSYDNPASAEAAIQTMNGFQIANKKLIVRHKTDGPPGGASAMGAGGPAGVNRFKPY